MIQKEIDVSVPFNTIKKTYPNGDIVIKKLKFIIYKIKEGYELIEKERSANHEIKKQKDTYASVVRDYRDKQILAIRAGITGIIDEEKIIASFEPRIIEKKIEDEEQKKRKKIIYNISITRNKIYDLARSNDFNYFITLTYNSKKCDRYSFSECSKKIRKYMNNFSSEHKKDCPNFKYLIVPEMHKDGAYHYHGLIYLEDIGSLKDTGKLTKKGNQIIYNWGRWKNGFSTVTEIENQEATQKYILKYISKEIDKDYCKGQRHFYYSQNCLKPEKETLLSNDDMWVLYNQIYDTDRSTGYEINKKELWEMDRMIIDHQHGFDIGEYKEN